MPHIAPPPIEMMFDGPQDNIVYLTNGQEFLGIYRDLCNLLPCERILDVGSGIGRKTIPLTDYLSLDGSYNGIDVTRSGVQWCTDNISSVYPNFRFQHVDVDAPGYNPGGALSPDTYVFPFDSDSFDFVTVCSVFTHMKYRAVQNYLKEIRRVLKPDGRVLATYFLVNDANWHVDRVVADFPYSHAEGRIARREFPEQAIAFYEPQVAHAYDTAGLSITRIEHGHWSGSGGLSYQDLILAHRR